MLKVWVESGCGRIFSWRLAFAGGKVTTNAADVVVQARDCLDFDRGGAEVDIFGCIKKVLAIIGGDCLNDGPGGCELPAHAPSRAGPIPNLLELLKCYRQ